MCGTPLVVQPMRGYHLHSTNYSQTETQPRPGSSGSRGGALDLGVIILDRPPSTCGVLHCLNYLHADGQVCSYAEKWEEAVLHIHQVHIQSKKVKKKICVGKHKTQTASHVWKLCSTVVKKCVSWSNTSVMKCIRGHFLYSEWVPCDTCC